VSRHPEHVLVVGAGLGGLRTAEQLRAAGFPGRIGLVGAEPHLPYDRPPLSKQLLTGEWDPPRAVLRDADGLDDLGIRTHLGLPAVALRPGEVVLDDGASLYADAVVLATGLVARRLPGQPAGVHTLRTLDDALALRTALAGARSLAVVGGGFIGAEVATSARTRGVAVTVLEALPVPLAGALGEQVGALCARLAVEAGVDLRTGVRVERFVDEHTLELAGGDRVTADVVVVGVGGRPELGWLAGSGVPAGDGIACDATGRVAGVEGVWALGDVAAWPDPVRGGVRRVEHWTSAGEQARVVARDVLGLDPPAPRVPYVWSDQFGLKIQVFGRPELADDLIALHGTGLAGGPVAGTVIGCTAGDRLVAVVGFGAPRLVMRHRVLLARAAGRDEALALAAELG